PLGIDARAESDRVVAETVADFSVPGIGDRVNARVFRGDSSRLGYLLVAGRWFSGPGEVVAPKALIQDAQVTLGDHFSASLHGSTVRLVLVGEVYEINSLGHSLFMDWAKLSTVAPDLTPDAYL